MAKLNLGVSPTSVMLRVKLLDSAVTTGAGKTGLSSSSSGLIISTIKAGEATPTVYTQSGSTIETITTLGTYAAPTATKCRFKEVDATNHKGVYEIQIADARFASTGSLLISISGVTGLAEADIEVQCSNLDVNVVNNAGTAITAAAGIQEVKVASLAANAITATSIASDAITAAKVATDVTTEIQTGLATAADIADAVCDELLSGHTTAGSLGKAITDILTKAAFLPSATAGAAGGLFIAGANAATSITTALTANLIGNITGNLSGPVTLAAGAVQAIWDAATSVLTTTGSIGKRIADFLTGDAFVRLGAPVGASHSADIATLKTDTLAIKVKTDSLTFTKANEIDANVQSLNGVAVTGDGSAGDKFGV